MLRRLAPVFALVAVFTIATSAWAIDAKGKVKTVSADKNEFVMTDADGKDWTITCSKDAKIQLNAKDAKLADLQANDEVQISYEKEGDKLVASSVRATRK
jgi:invasion protein IalB